MYRLKQRKCSGYYDRARVKKGPALYLASNRLGRIWKLFRFSLLDNNIILRGKSFVGDEDGLMPRNDAVVGWTEAVETKCTAMMVHSDKI